jgi:hypothetical protein
MARGQRKITDESKLAVARSQAKRHVEMLRRTNAKVDPHGEVELPEEEYETLEEELTLIFMRHAA